jgi:hypothetical protein
MTHYLPLVVAVTGISIVLRPLSSDQMKEDEIGGACSTHEIDERSIQNFGPET